MIFDDTPCTLGEGALWHPDRQSLIWFDIIGRRMFEKPMDGARRHWDFADPVSAAGIVDADRIIVASSRALSLVDLRDGAAQVLVPLEADNAVTRSNDGRADPQGGFWIGTMGLNAEPGAGSIWRFHRGELRRLFPDITITNAICFSPERDLAHFADTDRSTIWQVRLDRDGWPAGDPQVFIDLNTEGLNPDGAVIDAEAGCGRRNGVRGASRAMTGRAVRPRDRPARAARVLSGLRRRGPDDAVRDDPRGRGWTIRATPTAAPMRCPQASRASGNIGSSWARPRR